MSYRYLNMSQLAENTGLDRRTVKDRLEGVEPHAVEGKAIIFDSHKVNRILYGLEKVEEKNGYKLLQVEQIRSEKAKADKLELEVAQTKGELVAIEDVCRTVGKEYTYVRAAILGVPVKLAKPISLESDPAVCREMLKKEVDEILNHLQADINLEISPEESDEKFFPEDETTKSETNEFIPSSETTRSKT